MPRVRQVVQDRPEPQPLPDRLTKPRLHDYLDPETIQAARGPTAGRRLSDQAEPLWRADVDDWYASWCSTWPDVDPEIVDFDTAQKLARERGSDEDQRIVLWCRAVSIGNIGPKW